MRNSAVLVMEIIWIVTGLAALILGIHRFFTKGENNIYIFILISLVSFLFARIRHNQRKKG
jgi:hypothetical protein